MLYKRAEEVTSPTNVVISNDNHVYFYSEVTADKVVDLLKCLRQADIDLRTEIASRELLNIKEVPIWLHVNSSGGDVFAALSVADQIERLKSPVYGIIEGLCASAATFIALSCHKRFITPHSFILAHEFSSGFYGRYQEFKDEVVLQDMLFKTFVDFYAGKTNLTVEDLHDKLKHNWWLDAKQAVEFGFVDFILGE